MTKDTKKAETSEDQGKAGAKAAETIDATAAASVPRTWYFPSGKKGYVTACDYNEKEKQYNLNCREMLMIDIPSSVAEVMTRLASVA